jgi:hypothetical protein
MSNCRAAGSLCIWTVFSHLHTVHGSPEAKFYVLISIPGQMNAVSCDVLGSWRSED